MIIPPVHDPSHRATALRREVARDIHRIIEDLDFRREFLRDIWSVHRDRGPFIDTAVARWTELDASDLLHFTVTEVAQMDAFYRALADFQMYLRYTEDMPTTLLDRFDRSLTRLRDLGEQVVKGLGGTERPIGEFDDGNDPHSVLSLFAPPQRDPPPDHPDDEDPADWQRETEAALRKLYD